jgi:hypothetical protein
MPINIFNFESAAIATIIAIHCKHNSCRSPRRGAKLAGKRKRCHNCHSPRRGANSIPNFKEIENWENDAIFCNPNFKEIEVAKMASFSLTDLSPSILRNGVAVNRNNCRGELQF